MQQLLAMRSWAPRKLRRIVRHAVRDRLVGRESEQQLVLTQLGIAEAHRAARNHRMWELYLIEYAEIAPSHVDRDADMIEHVLSPEIMFELERLLAESYPEMSVPPSPHAIPYPSS